MKQLVNGEMLIELDHNIYITVIQGYKQVLIHSVPNAATLTLLLMRSTCLFWDSISLPMSMAMFLRLPSMPLTCVRFSSISSSLASLVILSKQKKYKKTKHVLSELYSSIALGPNVNDVPCYITANA